MRDHLDDELLDNFLQGSLDPCEQSRVETHLAECVNCARRLRLLKETPPDESEMSVTWTMPPSGDRDHFPVDHADPRGRFTVTTPPGGEVEVRTRLKLVATVGSGGLGEVYEYTDGTFQRSVAIKILRDRHLSNPVCVERFRREMEITATIDHPGCPAVYGAGRTQDGRDFFWMQLVTGPTLQEVLEAFHARHRRLRRSDMEVRQLLETFRAICQTIAAAHERGIIHRDLKPQNVRVHRDGHPIVLDWGLAKKISDAEIDLAVAGQDEPELSQHGISLGTPSYMSPEQARGEITKLDKRTDVYGLGSILYELLTGRPPHADLAARSRNNSEWLRAVGDGHLPNLDGVPGALASICRKAMAVEPGDRYVGPHELAADIESWLAGEEVLAHRYGLPERAALRIQRHPFATAAILLALFLTVLATVWGLEQERAARRQIVDVFRTATDVYQKIVAMSVRGLWDKGAADVNDEALRVSIGDLEKLLQYSDDVSVEDIQIVAEALRRLAVFLRDGSDSTKAAEVAERVVRIWRELNDRYPEQKIASRNLLASLHLLADVYSSQDRHELALATANEAVAISNGLSLGPELVHVERQEQGGSYLVLGEVLLDSPHPHDAFACFQKAEQCFVDSLALLGTDAPPDDIQQLRLRYLLASARCAAGIALHKNAFEPRSRRVPEDVEQQELRYYRQAVEELQDLHPLDPENIEFRRLRCRVLLHLGLHEAQSDHTEAIETFNAAVDVARELVRDFPAHKSHHFELAVVTGHLADALHNIGRLRDATDHRLDALGDCEGLIRRYPSNQRYRSVMASNAVRLADSYHRRGYDQLAVGVLQRTLRAGVGLEESLADTTANVVPATLGYVLLSQFDRELRLEDDEDRATRRAEQHLDKAIDTLRLAIESDPDITTAEFMEELKTDALYSEYLSTHGKFKVLADQHPRLLELP